MRKNLLLASLFLSSQLFAQSTYMQVYSIFQAKCASCHNSSVFSGSLDLASAPSVVYTHIVNHNPVNPASLALGHKLISGGEPHRSLLLRKINNGLDTDNNISVNEGAAMPQSPNPALSNYEIELVRQWVLSGAPQTGMVVDTALLTKFYSGYGITNPAVPLAPPSTAGFQIHLGKVFVAPASESEVFIKYNTRLTDTTEVYRVQPLQPAQSHHLVIYKFFPGQDVNYAKGFRSATGTGGNGPSHASADALSAFSPLTLDHVLPAGTAYRVEKNAVFDLNLHIVNPNPDSVLGAEVYINFYTQPKGTAQKIMYRRNFPDLSIVIPPGDSTIYDNVAAFDSTETNMWEIWIMYTHTHRYGVDYDIWKRNPDFTKGDQVYEGFYDFDYAVNQGYYGWGVHGAQERFSPFLEINPQLGFLSRAKWYNFGTDTVRFGLTSLTEMSVIGFEYTYGPPIATAGLQTIENSTLSFKTYPNPYSDVTKITYSLKESSKVKLEVYNVLGEKVQTLAEEEQNKGNYQYTFNNSEAGIYFLAITVNGKRYLQKLIQTD